MRLQWLACICILCIPVSCSHNVRDYLSAEQVFTLDKDPLEADPYLGPGDVYNLEKDPDEPFQYDYATTNGNSDNAPRFRRTKRQILKHVDVPEGEFPDYSINITQVLHQVKLSNGYDKRIRPFYKGTPVQVGLTMFISGISAVSEVNMDITLDFYFRQMWWDGRLNFEKKWPEELIIGGEFMREIWRPDTFFPNAKGAQFHYITQMNTFLRIQPDGNVTQSLRLTVTASCPMDFTYFPMDSQKCTLEIESFGYTTADIAYHWAGSTTKEAVGFSKDVPLPQFKVKGHRLVARHIVLSTGNYSRLAVEIFFSRSMGYYLIQVYIPSVLIVMLSWVSFWINRDSAPARIMLGITTVLTMTTLISSTNAALPKISYLKSIDVYLVSCFIMVFAALLEYAAVAYTAKRLKMAFPLLNSDTPEASSLRPVDSSSNGLAGPDSQHNGSVTNRKPQPFTKTTEKVSLVDDLKINLGGDEDDDVDYCSCVDTKASDIEKYSRIVFPTVFACFNILYWITYLNISVSTDEDGFIRAED